VSEVNRFVAPISAHLNNQQHQAAQNDKHSYKNNVVNTVLATVTLILIKLLQLYCKCEQELSVRGPVLVTIRPASSYEFYNTDEIPIGSKKVATL
jgi:hypothetical protein